MILNPDKFIRAAYIESLQTATGVKVWHKKIPKNTSPVPSKYIILDSLTKNETVKAKGEYFEWLCTIDVNIYNVKASGYSSAAVVDDLEQVVLNVVRMGNVRVMGFSNKNTAILETQDLSAETTTQSVDRKLIKFEHWLSRGEL
jgi:hypothetical protein